MIVSHVQLGIMTMYQLLSETDDDGTVCDTVRNSTAFRAPPFAARAMYLAVCEYPVAGVLITLRALSAFITHASSCAHACGYVIWRDMDMGLVAIEWVVLAFVMFMNRPRRASRVIPQKPTVDAPAATIAPTRPHPFTQRSLHELVKRIRKPTTVVDTKPALTPIDMYYQNSPGHSRMPDGSYSFVHTSTG